MKEKVLFFNPHAGILEHLKIERDLVRLVTQSGYSMEIFRCNGIYKNNCSVMNANGVNFRSPTILKENICASCRKYDSQSRNRQKDGFSYLEELLTERISTKVHSILDQINQENWSVFQLDGDFIGRLASYEFLLNNKIVSSSIPDELWGALKSDISQYLFTYFLALEWLKKTEYRFVGVYNFLYGVNRAFVAAANKLKIETFSIQGSGYLYNLHNRYMIYPTNSEYWHLNNSEKWTEHKDSPIKMMSALRVFRHLNCLISARSVFTYSLPAESHSAKRTRKKLGIPDGKQIHLLTTSSADELFAFGFVGLLNVNYENLDLFKSTKEWILKTVEIFASQPEKILVIRPHPREFANKRDSVNSAAGADLVDFLRKLVLPRNVIINYPEDKVSLYDLAPITDLLINSTSTVGLEFAALGIPSICVSPTTISAYPPDISTPIHSINQYWGILSEPHARKTAIMSTTSFRWLVFKHESCSIRIPISYRFVDRIYFGILRRLLERFPKFSGPLGVATNSTYKFLKLIDRRRLRNINTVSGSESPKRVTSIIEKFLLLSIRYALKRSI
jgi:hypothetical protein